MRYFLSCLLVSLLLVIGCSKTENTGKPVVFVSILPQAYFVEKAAGDLVEIEVLVGPGQSPHSFEPTPKQMAKLSKADIYFTIGVPFEKGFVKKIQSSNPDLKIIATDEGIAKRTMKAHHHHDDDEEEHEDHENHDDNDDHDGHDDHDEGAKDPHIWLDPMLVKKQASVIADVLGDLLPEKKRLIKENLERFARELDALDDEIRDKLEPFKGEELFVFHPSFGYFADRYGLVQEPIEIEGKEPSAKQLARIIEKAKKDGVRILFVQPQFAKTSAQTIAKEIGGVVVPINHLAKEYIPNLKSIAEAVSSGLQEKK